MVRLRQWLVAAADITLGAACVACEQPAIGLCPQCRAELAECPRQVRPQPAPDGFPLCYSAAGYGGVTQAAITAYKDHDALSLAGPLADRLTAAVAALLRDHPVSGCVLVPMPSSARAVRRRGLDAVGDLAAMAARRSRAAGIQVSARHVLGYARPVADQAGLSSAARARNMSGALRIRRGRARSEEPVVLIDDVVTTGASLAEAARCLSVAGWSLLGAATVAVTRRHGSLVPDRVCY